MASEACHGRWAADDLPHDRAGPGRGKCCTQQPGRDLARQRGVFQDDGIQVLHAAEMLEEGTHADGSFRGNVGGRWLPATGSHEAVRDVDDPGSGSLAASPASVSKPCDVFLALLTG